MLHQNNTVQISTVKLSLVERRLQSSGLRRQVRDQIARVQTS